MRARSIAERADVLPQLAEVFRAHGYEGATLALISDATGLGKGSLYNFFPGGKEQMAMEVLTPSTGGSPTTSIRRCGHRPIRQRASPTCLRRSMIISALDSGCVWSAQWRSAP